jgi:ribosome-binding protein aMBF1 (putative translation factor)
MEKPKYTAKEETAFTDALCARCDAVINRGDTCYQMMYEGGAFWFCPVCYARALPNIKQQHRTQAYRDAIRINQLAYEMIDNSRAAVGRALREYRKVTGLSQRDLTTLLDCDYTYISKIENGHENPGLDLIKKMQALDK